MTETDLTSSPDIQGIFFRGYVKLDQAAYGFFRVTDRALFQDWLSGMLKEGAITSAKDKQPADNVINRMNIAFTSAGMSTLLAAGYIAESYDHSFAAGMVVPERSRILGDTEANDPKNWDWGAKQDEIHGVLMSFATSKDIAEERLLAALCQVNGADCVHRTFGHLEDDNREPFGFKDGVSQPIIKGTKRAKKVARENPDEARVSIVEAGELIMGYPDGTGEIPRSPATSAGLDPDGILDTHPEWKDRRDLGKNGSYLVFRQLAQDTVGFWDYLSETASGEDGDTALELAEKMIGRRKDGEAMEQDPAKKPRDNNSFDFSKDRAGLQCPIGSHVRRSNNRAVNIKSEKLSLDVTMRHRILRRARIFDDNNGQTGLQFMCFNASIVRQFEFVQSAWCNNSFFQGLQKEVDPIVGTHRPAKLGAPEIDRYTIPQEPYRKILKKVPQFVTVKGGAYFFLPSLKALQFISQTVKANADQPAL